jgi:hypothetical protein
MNTKCITTVAMAVTACASTVALGGPPQAYQQGNCIYAGPPAANHSNLHGCYGRLANGRLIYMHVSRSFLDVQSNNWLRTVPTRLLVWSNRQTWEPIQTVQGGPELLAQMRAGLPAQGGGMVITIPAMLAYGPGGGFPGAGGSGGSGGGAWAAPDCRNLRGNARSYLLRRRRHESRFQPENAAVSGDSALSFPEVHELKSQQEHEDDGRLSRQWLSKQIHTHYTTFGDNIPSIGTCWDAFAADEARPQRREALLLVIARSVGVRRICFRCSARETCGTVSKATG